MDIYQVDSYINDLMQKVDDGEATEQEIYFLKNLLADLKELFT